MPTVSCAKYQRSREKLKLTATLRSNFLDIPCPAATKKKKRPPFLTHFSYGDYQRRPSVFAPWETSQASQAPTIPSSKGGMPSNPS
ncbi:hypothetical protein AAG906_008188 [Vitis piasezkii]